MSESSTLKCVPLPYLVALKLYGGSRQDLADVVEVLAQNPDADFDEIRSLCKEHGVEGEGANSIDKLIEEAAEMRHRPNS